MHFYRVFAQTVQLDCPSLSSSTSRRSDTVKGLESVGAWRCVLISTFDMAASLTKRPIRSRLLFSPAAFLFPPPMSANVFSEQPSLWFVEKDMCFVCFDMFTCFLCILACFHEFSWFYLSFVVFGWGVIWCFFISCFGCFVVLNGIFKVLEFIGGIFLFSYYVALCASIVFGCFWNVVHMVVFCVLLYVVIFFSSFYCILSCFVRFSYWSCFFSCLACV